MFQIFTDFATWLVYECLSLSPATKLGEAIHFVEDVSKFSFSCWSLIYFVAMLRASLDIERVKILQAPWWGIYWALRFAVTPFCSCSSIPVFLGFTSAGIPSDYHGLSHHIPPYQ
jgi:hypothetical protein